MPIRSCCLLSTRALPSAASNVSRRGHNASHPVELVDTAAARANHPGSRRFPSLVTLAIVGISGGQLDETYSLRTCCQPRVHLQFSMEPQVRGSPNCVANTEFLPNFGVSLTTRRRH